MTKSRSRSLTAALVALIAVIAVDVVSCAETRRSIGEDCLKDEECVSGICSSLKCAAAPPILGNTPPPDASPDAPAIVDAAADAGSNDAASDVASDAAID